MRHADRIYADERNTVIMRAICITMLAVLVIACLAAPYAASAAAQQTGSSIGPGRIYRVKVSAASLLDAPGKTGGEIARVQRGDEVTLVNGSNKTWAEVRTVDGTTGYVKKTALTYARTLNAGQASANSGDLIAAAQQTSSNSAGEVYAVVGKSATLKTGSSASSKTLDKYKAGAQFTLIAKVGNLLCLRDENGRIGYGKAGSFRYVEALSQQPSQATPPPQTAQPAQTVQPALAAAPPPQVTQPVQPSPEQIVWKPLTKNVAMDVVALDKQKYSYATMASDIEALNRKFPGQMVIQTIGKSKQGKNIYAVQIGNPSAAKSILVDGSLHAREYMATLLIMRQIEYYLSNPNDTYKGEKISSILNRCSIWFVPMCNPDGVNLSQNGLSAATEAGIAEALTKMNNGSANFERWKANIDGIDLNNNFPAGFKQGKSAPASEGFGGNGPLTTSETKALSSFLMSNPKIAATMNYHSVGNVIYWHYGQTGAKLTRDKAIATELGTLTGYILMPEYYNTASGGGFMDYVIAHANLPSFTLELGPANVLAPQPISQFTAIWNNNKFAPLHLAWRKLS